MSVFGGIWNTDSRPIDEQRLLKLSEQLSQFGPDGSGRYISPSCGMVYRAAHVTTEDTRETQPFRTGSGNVVTWDGRLDNRCELITKLREDHLTGEASDVELVAAALEKWGPGALPELLGDWCLAFWKGARKELLLATDYAGNRRCYYCRIGSEVMWSSALAPIVTRHRGSLHVSEEYMAAYSYKATPAALTPYREILVVKPGTAVNISVLESVTSSYWCWNKLEPIRYSSAADYDDHFRHLFRTAVKRRLRTFKPALAELSGGVDSSSVVCCANDAIRSGQSPAPKLLTVSYYDDRDPAGDERPYSSIVEGITGRTGWHINLADHDGFRGPFTTSSMPFPGMTPARHSLMLDLRKCHEELKPGVVLSGSGGDEVLGGLTSAVCHIADHLKERRPGTISLLAAWSLTEKETRLNLARRVLAEIALGTHNMGPATKAPTAPWMREDLRVLGLQYSRGESQLPPTSKGVTAGMTFLLFGLASVMRRSWNKLYPMSTPVYQTYPYLDRELIQFLLSIPIDQIYAPGQRRKLMRRALEGLVPREILWRTNKGYSAYSALSRVREYRTDIETRHYSSPFFSVGFADRQVFATELAKAAHGIDRRAILLLASQSLELWLRDNYVFVEGC